jgi:hypothetical protein
VTDPPIEQKLKMLHAMDALGIDTADIGLPGVPIRLTLRKGDNPFEGRRRKKT